MDNTQVISSNGTAYDKLFKGSNGITAQKAVAITATTTTTTPTTLSSSSIAAAAQLCFDHRKGFTNTGSMYTIGSGSGQAQILMNTQSVMTATNLSFVPPARTKTTLSTMHGISPIGQPIKMSSVQQNVSFLIPESDLPEFFLPQTKSCAITTNSSFALTKMRIHEIEKSALNFIQQQTMLIPTTSGPIIEKNPKFEQNSMDNDMKTTTTTTGETLVNTMKTIKSFFNYLIKPITHLVGTDNNGTTTSNNIVWNDKNATAGGSPIANKMNLSSSTTSSSSPSQHYYNDCNHGNNERFCFNCEQTNPYFLNENFFDCDDYIDGGEDTIDFVADSTNIQYNVGYDMELDKMTTVQQSSPKDHIFYDCINKSPTDEMIELREEEQTQKKCAPDLELVNCGIDESIGDDDSGKISIDENVQYNKMEEKSPMNCPKYEKSNPKSYRRKRHGKRKQNKSHHNHRTTKGHNGQKNRHEKYRHEVEQNIHDDIDDCSVVKDCISYDDDDDEDDLEIIDVDDDNLPKSHNSSATTNVYSPAIQSTSNGICIETPIPSPETIKTGCIFTQFFRFDNSNCKQKSLPMRCIQKLMPQIRPMKERSITCRRSSENSESDDSFIVFEDSSPRSTASIDDIIVKSNNLKDTYKRQRQISECSDDFILFEDDTDDTGRRYDTTDEDFTDSTDDSDNSDDESGDESDSSDCSLISQRKHDGESNQPDSGFEEKKVTFNLCPKVHEIRAWKFAYSQARKGKWEQMGRDRERFEKRINGLSRILSPMLAADHRQKIYEQRFRNEE